MEVYLNDIIDNPTPVELISFTAKKVNNGVLLNWETATEVNNYGFEIQSAVGQKSFLSSWETIGFVNGHGNSNSPNEYSYLSNSAATSYRLKQIDTDGSFEYSDVITVDLEFVNKLLQNYPNPFNPSTSIKFSIAEEGKVSIAVFNILGEKIVELLNKELTAGNHSVVFNASNLTSGIYFYRLQIGGFVKSKKLILLK